MFLETPPPHLRICLSNQIKSGQVKSSQVESSRDRELESSRARQLESSRARGLENSRAREFVSSGAREVESSIRERKSLRIRELENTRTREPIGSCLGLCQRPSVTQKALVSHNLYLPELVGIMPGCRDDAANIEGARTTSTHKPNQFRPRNLPLSAEML